MDEDRASRVGKCYKTFEPTHRIKKKKCRREETGQPQALDGSVPEKQPEDGVVLHQPLNRAIFRFFGKKGRKMNGVSVCLCPKSQNAPTWQVEKQAGRSVIFGFSATQKPVPPLHTLHY